MAANERYVKSRQMDEREKLRKFRELDDAFAQALRDLDGTSQERVTPANDRLEFEDRLTTLMQEYSLSRETVHELIETLSQHGKLS